MASPQALQRQEESKRHFEEAAARAPLTRAEEIAESERLWPEFGRRPVGVEFVGGVANHVEVEWAVPDGVMPQSGPVVLYLHGGGYHLGSIATHRHLAGHLAQASNARTLQVEYRLAPEHPFPAGLDDCMAVYRWLLDEGCPSTSVVIAGDSAGGGLALAMALRLRDEGYALPAGVVTFSAWTDLTLSGSSFESRKDSDPMAGDGSEEDGEQTVLAYLAGADPRHPWASPVFGEYAGLPPLLLQVGDFELILDDSVRVADLAMDADVSVDLEVWSEMTHVFQLGVGFVPEADEAVRKAGAWIQGRV